MSKSSHAAARVSEQPTPAQLKELMAQIESGRITKQSLQNFLRPKPKTHPDVYIPDRDQLPKEVVLYWDEVLPGMGELIANEIKEFFSEDLELDLSTHDPEEVNDGFLRRNIFWEGFHGFRVVLLKDLPKVIDVDGGLYHYGYKIDKFVMARLKAMEGLLGYAGSDAEMLKRAADEFITAPEESPFSGKLLGDSYQVFSGEGGKLWGIVNDSLASCIFALAMSPLMDEETTVKIRNFSSLWYEDRNFPIGCDSDGKLLILCAPSK